MGLSLNLFWHMHQPDYRNQSGVMQMPWVFLHAIKDYYEMPWHLMRHRAIKATFNITPPLIEQLLLYIEKGVECDLFLKAWQKHPRDLNSHERAFVFKICHAVQKETMVDPLPRFAELFELESLDDDEWIELEVLFLLAWCGNYLRQKDETVQKLLRKGRGFTHQEKEALLEVLMAFLPSILPLYAQLLHEGRISLATTPMNHPILPLLLDMRNAKRSNPHTVIPANHMPLVEDAVEHVQRAIALYQRVFAHKPTGFWPAEGAVDEKSLSLYKEMGLKWIATDEAILFKSLPENLPHDRLYSRYRYKDLFIAFRDHRLSDLIGFKYRYRPSDEAAEDFLKALEEIKMRTSEGVVSVILDGENAWEFYKNNGFDFFEAFYGRLSATPWCQTVTMDELARKRAENLTKLFPGSWIYGNFDTWVGHPEKNAAWELLFQTREDYMNHESSLDEKKKKVIQDHFLAAECSDWFWWYGEDHFTEFSQEFDTLFRSHLIAIYQAMELPSPSNLFQRIGGERGDFHSLVNEPKSPIHPIIDGKVSSFFEWLGSGVIDESRLFTTMEGARGPVERIYWGESEKAFYLRMDGKMEVLRRMQWLRIHVRERNEIIDIDLRALPFHGEISAAMDEILEIALSKAIYFKRLQYATLRMELVAEGEVRQVLPGTGALKVDLKGCYAKNWFV